MGGDTSSYPGQLPSVTGSLGTNTETAKGQGQRNSPQRFLGTEGRKAEPTAAHLFCLGNRVPGAGCQRALASYQQVKVLLSAAPDYFPT